MTESRTLHEPHDSAQRSFIEAANHPETVPLDNTMAPSVIIGQQAGRAIGL
jgi:hypothetical protein